MAINTKNNEPKSSAFVVDYLKRFEKNPRGYKAIHIQASNLPQENQKIYARTAAETFEEMVQANKGQLFNLGNEDIIFFYENSSKDEVESFKVKLNFLFADSLENESQLIIDYDLQKDFATLLNIVEEITSTRPNNYTFVPKTTSAPNVFVPKFKPPPKGTPLTPVLLAKVEKALSNADFANMVRRQSICAIVGKALPQPLFDEVFVSIADLRETILPETDFSSTPWLFQHMTETLDKRVLSNINKHDDGSLNCNFSINLNVSTVLSNDFLVFDDNINASMRSTIVIEMQIVDIFSDLASYILARDFARNRGYRICLDAISLDIMPYVDRVKLGADMVKIVWNQELSNALLKDKNIVENIKRIGNNKIIFCRVDDEAVVEIGQNHGITMFQGRYIQRLLFSDPRRKRVGTVLIK